MAARALSRMTISEELLQSDVEVLGHGGQAAIALFLDMSKRLHETGSPEALRDWIAIAASALPAAERAEVMFSLMYGHLYVNYGAAQASGAPRKFH